jgi:hypothetical protein
VIVNRGLFTTKVRRMAELLMVHKILVLLMHCSVSAILTDNLRSPSGIMTTTTDNDAQSRRKLRHLSKPSSQSIAETLSLDTAY